MQKLIQALAALSLFAGPMFAVGTIATFATASAASAQEIVVRAPLVQGPRYYEEDPDPSGPPPGYGYDDDDDDDDDD